jgi:hypothetical protein
MRIREKRSAIINLSSVAGIKPIPNYAIYSSTKVDFFYVNNNITYFKNKRHLMIILVKLLVLKTKIKLIYYHCNLDLYQHHCHILNNHLIQ